MSWPGSTPERELPWMYIVVSRVSLPNSVGTVPEKLLPWSMRWVSRVSWPIRVGMVPDKELPYKWSAVSCVFWKSSVGSVPVRPCLHGHHLLPELLGLPSLVKVPSQMEG